MNISHSKVELYNQCPAKFKLKYIDKLEVNKTYTPLLFGKACDEAFNYLLLQKKNNLIIDRKKCKDIFKQQMLEWQGENELVFFKNESPKFKEIDPKLQQQEVWSHLCSVGYKMIDVYVDDILPIFEEIVDVQITKKIDNADGDTLTLIVDFTAKLKNGKVITFDNKTTSDIKKNYPKNSVEKSQQLAIYSDFAENREAGYIVLEKKLIDDKIKWDLITGEIPEQKSIEAFNRVDNALEGIKSNQFNKNVKACYSFGIRCPYYSYCHFGNMKDIIDKTKQK